jgi:hypothetical protein
VEPKLPRQVANEDGGASETYHGILFVAGVRYLFEVLLVADLDGAFRVCGSADAEDKAPLRPGGPALLLHRRERVANEVSWARVAPARRSEKPYAAVLQFETSPPFSEGLGSEGGDRSKCQPLRRVFSGTVTNR